MASNAKGSLKFGDVVRNHFHGPAHQEFSSWYKTAPDAGGRVAGGSLSPPLFAGGRGRRARPRVPVNRGFSRAAPLIVRARGGRSPSVLHVSPPGPRPAPYPLGAEGHAAPASPESPQALPPIPQGRALPTRPSAPGASAPGAGVGWQSARQPGSAAVNVRWVLLGLFLERGHVVVVVVAAAEEVLRVVGHV